MVWENTAVFCHLQSLVTVNNYSVFARTQISFEWFISLLSCSFFQISPFTACCFCLTAAFWKEHRWNKSNDVLTCWTHFLFHWITHTLWSAHTRNRKHGSGCMLETATFTSSYVIHAGISLATNGTQGNPKSLPADSWALFVFYTSSLVLISAFWGRLQLWSFYFTVTPLVWMSTRECLERALF